ncbi:MAG: ATP-binding protein [Gammaproteobacteria bacterium]|nr:ATP-binding protein [Gammaproteobacteria bacterium]
MLNRSLFPQGIVTGGDFCNRTNERKYLKVCISENSHVVISSPRRYGKTSLVYQTVQENRAIFHHIDFLPTNNSQYVKKAILDGAGRLLYSILPKHKQAEKKMLQLFQNLNPKLVLSTLGQTIELSSPQSVQDSIMEVLTNLDKAAEKFGKRAVLIMDEFQQVGLINEHHVIEASIRHAAERSKNITYIFSGSNRHLLAQMFSDKNRPLYHLCELLKIDRISGKDFAAFLQKKAKQKWGQLLITEALTKILDLTELHPYYVNSLCRMLWRHDEAPSSDVVSNIWHQYVSLQHSWITEDIARLSANQKSILAALAYEPTKELQGQAFVNKVGLIPASIKRVTNTLLKKDYIYKDQNGYYRVLDPAILYYFHSISYFDFG